MKHIMNLTLIYKKWELKSIKDHTQHGRRGLMMGNDDAKQGPVTHAEGSSGPQ